MGFKRLEAVIRSLGDVLRHIVVQEYDDVQHETIWRICTVHIPDQIQKLKSFVPAPSRDPQPQGGLLS
jgi:uncharacterized protein with HEPN domain